MAKQERALFNPFMGKSGRTQGVYLDEVERRRLEDYRARIEGREPDYDNLDIGYSPLVPESAIVDNTNMSNISAGRDPQQVDPVVVIENEVFDEPNVVDRASMNYVDALRSANAQARAGAPAGAPAGLYDDGGKGGPDFTSLTSKKSENEAAEKEKDLQKVASKAAEAVTVKPTNNSAKDSPTMAPENRPRDRSATKKTAAKKSTAKKTTAKKSTAKKTARKR